MKALRAHEHSSDNTTGYVSSNPLVSKHNANTQAYTSYINIDSSKRIKNSTNIYDDQLYSLPPFALRFTNGSNLVTVALVDQPFAVDDRIILNNVISKNVILQNVIMVKKNSLFVRIFHQNHGLSFYGLYNPYNPGDFNKIDYVDRLPIVYNELDDIPDGIHRHYIYTNNSKMDFRVQLSNIKGCGFPRTFIGNIPTNYLNGKHNVYLLFVKNNGMYIQDPDSYLIKLEKKSSINYMDGVNTFSLGGKSANQICTNTVYIKYYNLFGIPLTYLNVDEKNAHSYLTIVETTQNTFTIDVRYPAIVDPNMNFYHYSDLQNYDIDGNQYIGPNFGGGDKSIVRKILSTISGYPNPNNYEYQLDRIYKNIIQARIIGSIFPNSQKIINNNPSDTINNKLYWRNLSDGDYIYQLSITPGNYSPKQLSRKIENCFSRTLRYPYRQEFSAGFQQSIIESSISNNTDLYDDDGYYKYHIVNVNISSKTDEVSLESYRELSRSDDLFNGSPILFVPDFFVQFTLSPFVDNALGTGGILLIYFTPNSHCENNVFPYAYNNLYKFELTSDADNAFVAQLETITSILVNFNRTIKNLLVVESHNELKSINTKTLLTNFTYNHLTSEVYKADHNLKLGDLIITDQFIEPNTIGLVFVYEIIKIIDEDKLIVKKYNYGEKYKFIYDSFLINFGQIATDSEDSEIIAPVQSVSPLEENKFLMVVNHRDHQLSPGTMITISNSLPINQVPESVINTSHTIHRIIDDNHYEIKLKTYIPNPPQPIIKQNTIVIRYPDIFQMFFNFSDTFGEKLSFRDIGKETSVTPYKHRICNTDPYMDEPNAYYHNPKKLDMTGNNYFYLSSPELGHIRNTDPVDNVFSIIRWSENPGGVSFDSYVPTIRVFNPPIASLNKLHFTLSHPDGRLIDFNGLDHSFQLELTELYNEPSGTNISPHINSEVFVRKI